MVCSLEFWSFQPDHLKLLHCQICHFHLPRSQPARSRTDHPQIRHCLIHHHLRVRFTATALLAGTEVAGLLAVADGEAQPTVGVKDPVLAAPGGLKVDAVVLVGLADTVQPVVQ